MVIEIPLKGIKGVLSDMDGTLTDSETHLRRINGEACSIKGKEIGVDIPNLYTAGKRSFQSYAEWISEDSRSRQGVYDQMYSLYEKMRDKFFFDEEGFEMFEDADRFLELVQENFLKIALVTSNTRRHATEFLRQNGLSDEFLVSADDVNNLKPDPESYEKGAELLGLKPSECIALEDSAFGARSAVAAGVAMVIVRGAVPDEFRDYENVIGVSSFDEVKFV